jgi:predicted permease
MEGEFNASQEIKLVQHRKFPMSNLIRPKKSIKTIEEQNSESHDHKIRFSYIAFGIAFIWLVFVGCIVYSFFKKSQAPSVMIALLTTSTATVVGLPYLVLQGAYGTKQNPKQEI